MIKRAILILVVVALVAIGIDTLQESVSREIAEHIEAGNFINTDKLSEDKITMLHWFSQEVQVYSKDSRSLHFVMIEPSKGWLLYKKQITNHAE